MRTGTAVAAAAIVFVACGCDGRHSDNAIIASGHVEATDVRVSTKIGGTLEHFEIEEGDRLEKGQVIAQIDTVDLRLALQGASAERDQARADLALRQAGYREEDIAAAKAEVTRAAAELDTAQKELDRAEGLLAAGSGTPKARDDARGRRDVAAAALEAGRARVRKLEAGYLKQEIEAARARLEAAEARIAQLEQQISDATVQCPVGGVVTEKIAEQGELLAPGAELVVVTDLDHPWLTIYVSEPDLGRIRLGQEVEVVTDDGQRRSGRISFIASEAEFTPKNVQTRDERVKLVFEVKVLVPNEDGLFKPGMPAEARIRPSEPAS
jgi:HlyD family secretion protein